MTDRFAFTLLKTDGGARLGEIATPRGPIRTPAFMPVGTAATVKALYTDQLEAAGTDIVLANTYHLMLRPGAERVARLGGLHRFMRWKGPIITDSGGFQVMSLSKLRKITDAGVTFQSHIDGSTHSPHARARRRDPVPARLGHPDAARRVHRAAGHARGDASRRRPLARLGRARAKRAFARSWRRERRDQGRPCSASSRAASIRSCGARSADALVALDLPGYGIGGLAVGEPQQAMLDTLALTALRLPADKPRYLMGVGTPVDLIESVARGADMFDCVMPTRAGRHGLAFTWAGKVNLKNARHADDPEPARSGQHLPRRARLFARLPASPREIGGVPGRDAALVGQRRLLPAADGRHARGHRRGPVCGLGRGDEGAARRGNGVRPLTSNVSRLPQPLALGV